MAVNEIQPLPSWRNAGFNQYFSRPIFAPASSGSMTELNFDSFQTTGSLGDKIQIGGNNIVLDGKNRKISILDDSGKEVIVIGNING